MHIVFVSNFLNHHQIPFCEGLRSLCREFHFVATQDVKNIGFQTASQASYAVNYFEEDRAEYCKKLIVEADAVIFGACPNELIALRMEKHKLSFLFSERFFKKGTWRRFIPSTRKKVVDRIVKYKNEPMYVLCASAYLSYDLKLLSFPAEKCYRWGYLPEVKLYDSIDSVITLKKKHTILWCGRLLQWKHPELALKLAKRLKAENIDFELNIVGSGELEKQLKTKIEKYDLGDRVHMQGKKTPAEVREYMEQAEIFLFTSDRHEGWGAVLNESMNSGCAVVASRVIGSVPYLIKHGENGLIYDSEEELYRYVKDLLISDGKCGELGTAAYRTMSEVWNATVAAERFIKLVSEISNRGSCELFADGICSRENL